jgi:hypothetical protein
MLQPVDVRMQPVDSDDFAWFAVENLIDGGRGQRPDFAGPEVSTTRELARRRISPPPASSAGSRTSRFRRDSSER